MRPPSPAVLLKDSAAGMLAVTLRLLYRLDRHDPAASPARENIDSACGGISLGGSDCGIQWQNRGHSATGEAACKRSEEFKICYPFSAHTRGPRKAPTPSDSVYAGRASSHRAGMQSEDSRICYPFLAHKRGSRTRGIRPLLEAFLTAILSQTRPATSDIVLFWTA